MTLSWEKYVPYFNTKPNTKVVSIKWRLDGTKIAAVLNSDGAQDFTLILINPSNGALYYGAVDTAYTGNNMFPEGMRFDNSDNIFVF
jgi:hypothetical protein